MVRVSWPTFVRLAAVAALAMPACQCPRTTVSPPSLQQSAGSAAAPVLPTAHTGWDVQGAEIARSHVAPATFAARATAAAETPVPGAPSVSLGVDPDSGGAPLTVTLTADVGGQIPGLSFDWNFGDGTRSAGSAATVRHTYLATGEYTATVVARSPGGSDSDTADVEVDATGFDVDLDADPDSGPAPLQVTLSATPDTDDADTKLSSYRFDWQLGDGRHDFGHTVQATYRQPGTYTVSVEVTNAQGQKGRATTDLDVDAPDGE